ncbi:MAG: peptidase M19 [unclassified Hahellaceae]|nr:peptidase M19 [Hahellaceae bacterium]|tara:strand:- start:37074 stop:38417 length:1344 start_codon:yes stop_codon:yes gene_type:complete
MFRKLLKILLPLFIVVLLFLAGIKLFGAEELDQWLNRIASDPDAPVPEEADLALHRSMFIADLHADTLKWDRDLLERGLWGHLDVPRMVEGSVALQSFTIVTRSPFPFGRERFQGTEKCVDGDRLDIANVLATVQGRPSDSALARAVYQIERLKEAAARSRAEGRTELRLLLTAEDLRQLVIDRRNGEQVVGAILGIEGGHWVGAESASGSVEKDMKMLFDLGVRQFAATHRFDNGLAGSSEGCERYGLTQRGERALLAAEALGMAVDLAHMSEAGMKDAARLLSKPLMVSHTGVKGQCVEPCRPARNLSDDQIRLVLESGGIIGIGYWPYAVGPSIWHIADAMEYTMLLAKEMGLEADAHVSLGSDYDGSVQPFFDVSELSLLTAVMRQRPQPFSNEAIRNIAGLNVCRYFARILPGGSDALALDICATPSSDGAVPDLRSGSTRR